MPQVDIQSSDSAAAGVESCSPAPTQARLRELFDYRDGHLFHRQGRLAGKQAGTSPSGGYRAVWFGGRKVPEHRLIYILHHGSIPTPFLDHADRDPLNNRVENLRPATASHNARNRSKETKKGRTSKWKGVSWHSRDGYWRAYIEVDGRQRALGCHADEADAAMAYNAAALELFGEFAALNCAEQTCPLAA